MLDQLEGLVDRGQHPQPEQVELDQLQLLDVALVELDDDAVLHRRPLDRGDVDERRSGHEHAARVDREVAREAVDARAELQPALPVGHADRAPAPRLRLRLGLHARDRAGRVRIRRDPDGPRRSRRGCSRRSRPAGLRQGPPTGLPGGIPVVRAGRADPWTDPLPAAASRASRSRGRSACPGPAPAARASRARRRSPCRDLPAARPRSPACRPARPRRRRARRAEPPAATPAPPPTSPTASAQPRRPAPFLPERTPGGT